DFVYRASNQLYCLRAVQACRELKTTSVLIKEYRMHLPIDLVAEPTSPTFTHFLDHDDLSREVYGVLGLLVAVTDMATILNKITAAKAARVPFLISTVNLNFLAITQSDENFRDTLLDSDVCTADGISILWMTRLLGVPIKKRITGVDIFEALKHVNDPQRRIKLFLFGGPEGVAATACNRLNAETDGTMCAGSFYPGFCTVDEMSANAVIDIVNSSDADFLVVALGAKKGQAWLQRNRDAITIPVRAHLGATINYQAGTLKRAPEHMRKLGLEWLWRIKEEPQLWKRYAGDALVLLKLLLTRVVPLVILARWQLIGSAHKDRNLFLKRTEDHKFVILSIAGAATTPNVSKAAPCFRDAVAAAKDVVINFTGIHIIDTRFIGLLLMLDKRLK